MKKVLLSGALLFVFFGYVIHQKFDSEETPPVIPPSQQTQSQQTQPQNQQQAQQPMQNNMNPMMGKGYKDGTFTGTVTDAFYGNVQVSATISRGKITDVSFLQYPNDRGTSIEINSQAMPYLKQEAIQAQNANVDIVSGATQTSLAFRQSLASALSKAQG